MEPNMCNKMEEFLNKAEKLLEENAKATAETKKLNKKTGDTLTAFNKKVNFFIGSVLTVLLFMLGVVNNTRVEVVKKANASEVYQLFVTKQDALQAHIIEGARFKQMILDHEKGDTILDGKSYEWVVRSIFDINYRGEE